MAGLPWIQLHVDLPRHPKSVRLAVALRDERAWTYMAQLWLWCAEHVQGGTVAGDNAQGTIEFAAGWRGEQGKFFDAALAAGFIDRNAEGSISVHGWHERATAHVTKREKDAARMRALRDGSPESRNDVAATSQRVLGESTGKREIESNKKQILSGEKPPEKKSAKAPEAGHGEIIALFVKLWAEARPGSKYHVIGKRDGNAVKTLLTYPEAKNGEIERRMRLAFADPWFKQNGHLALFVSRWPNYDRAPTVGSKPTAPEARPKFTGFDQENRPIRG